MGQHRTSAFPCESYVCISALVSITLQITTRRREILTPSLKEALSNEVRRLDLSHIPLSLSDRGDLGDSIVEVGLSAQQRIARNSEVLSEGEQRGLAIACFLAELNEIGSDHGIILDDPSRLSIILA
jgi:hypothetical protein